MILLVTYNVRRRGGIERLSLQVAEGLRQEGHRCRLLATRRLGPGRPGRLVGQLWFLLQLAWWLPRARLVFSMHALLLRPIRLLQALPGGYPRGQGLLCWLHGIEVWGANLPPLLADLRACDALAASSSFSAAQVAAQLGERPPITVIHPCIERAAFAAEPWGPPGELQAGPTAADPSGPSFSGSFQSASDATAPERSSRDPGVASGRAGLRLLTVARMDSRERYKGHDLILEALALLQSAGRLPPALRWRVVGSGDDRARLQARAQALALAEQIDWLGSLDDAALEEEYGSCSLVMMPSAYAIEPNGTPRGEGFGITYLEAALAGRASIAADRGGQSDLILDGRTGWLIPPTAEALAALLERLQRNPEQVLACGAAARRHALAGFTASQQRRRLAQLVAPWSRPLASPPPGAGGRGGGQPAGPCTGAPTADTAATMPGSSALRGHG